MVEVDLETSATDVVDLITWHINASIEIQYVVTAENTDTWLEYAMQDQPKHRVEPLPPSTYNSLQGIFTTMIGFVTWPPFCTVLFYKVAK